MCRRACPRLESMILHTKMVSLIAARKRNETQHGPKVCSITKEGARNLLWIVMQIVSSFPAGANRTDALCGRASPWQKQCSTFHSWKAQFPEFGILLKLCVTADEHIGSKQCAEHRWPAKIRLFDAQKDPPNRTETQTFVYGQLQGGLPSRRPGLFRGNSSMKKTRLLLATGLLAAAVACICLQNLHATSKVCFLCNYFTFEVYSVYPATMAWLLFSRTYQHVYTCMCFKW